MTTSPRSLTVFFAHQFCSSVESSSKIRAAVRKAVERCEGAWNQYHPEAPVKLRYEAIEDIPAEAKSDIFTAVLRVVDEADICIFSLTDHNFNVIFELGYACGKDKENIWIRNENIPFDTLPSDYMNRFMLAYSGPADLKDKLEQEISDRIERVLGLTTPKYHFSEFWNLQGKRCAEIVAPALPAADRPKYAQTGNQNYLKYSSFADVDAVVHLIKFFQRAFVINCEEFTSETWHKAIDGPTVFVGAPIWNRAARRFYCSAGVTKMKNVLPAYFETVDNAEYDAIRYNGSLFQPSRIDEATVEEFGLFGRLLDPDNGQPIFIASGCSTHGTLAALRAFDDSEFGMRNCMKVLKDVKFGPEFFAFFKCRVRDGIPSAPNLSDPAQTVSIQRL